MSEKKTITEYNKNYYEKNKEKMYKQMKEATKRKIARDIVTKLNNEEYSRFPHEKIKKYNIKFSEIDKKYYI